VITVDTRAAAARFASTWQAGWAGHDAAAIVPLYAEDCVHRSMPFRPVHRGRAGMASYIRWTFGAERTTEVRFGEPMVSGDRAVVEFRATLVEQEDARPVTITGCALVRFGPDGLVAESRDYWQVSDGHRRPEGTMFLAGFRAGGAG